MERNGQDPRPTLSVSQLNECIKATLESAPLLRDVYVQGELSGVRLYASGHLYFSLKDENSAIGGVMFARQVSTLRFSPENGMRVILHGRVSVYAVRGQYQLVADALVPVGAGDLAVAFEQLKAKLGAEGLFDSARKKPLPPYPRRIGVITSPSGAAIHDIIRVARGRMPSVEILLFLRGAGRACVPVPGWRGTVLQFTCRPERPGAGGGCHHSGTGRRLDGGSVVLQ